MSRSTLYVRLIFVAIILSIIGILHGTRTTALLEKWFVEKANTVIAGNKSLSIALGDQYRFFSNKDEFIKNAALCFENEATRSVLEIEQQKLRDENAELRLLLNFIKTTEFKPAFANVISKDVGSSEQIIIIDKGTLDGLSIGMPVVAKEGIYIGSIIKVNTKTAAVRLLDDNTSKVAVTILNNDKSIGVLEGGFGISLKIRFIPRNENIRAGDKVITSGLETTIPRGLAIGTVSVVENEAYQPFQEAVVAPLVDFSKLSIVSVLTATD